MNITVEKNVPLHTHTTLKVGGTADAFVSVSTEESLVEAVLYAREHSLRFVVLGGGSNTLVADEGVRGLVIHNQIKGVTHAIEDTHVYLKVGAGEMLDDIVEHTVANNWWGIENLTHIPGTVGAAPVQNVGAYGVEVKDVVSSVRAYDTQKQQFVTLTAQQCAFGYRDSLFKKPEGKRFIITEVTFRLSTVPQPQLTYKDLATTFENREPSQREIREAVMKIRSKKFPDWHTVGTAGSFFKNPFVTPQAYANLLTRYPDMPGYASEEGVKIPLGWVLDKVLNLRGFEKENVATYTEQALVLIARAGASAEEIKTFADAIIDRIRTEVGIDVEWEVTQMQ